MKKLNTLLTLGCLFFMQTILAQNSSSAEVFSENGERFYIILNGVRQNEYPQTNIMVQGLTSEFYHIKVIFENTSIPTLEKKYFPVQDPDGSWGKVTYAVAQNKKGEYNLKFRGFVPAAQIPPPPPTVVVVPYNTRPMPAIGTIVVTETTTNTAAPSGDNVNLGMSVGGVNFGMNVNVGGSSNQTQQTTSSVTTTTVYGANPVPVAVAPAPYLPGYTGRIGCQGYPMDPNAFSNALNSVESKDFDNTKLSQAKQITSANCLTAAQVKQMTGAFDFENSRLEYAKFAYNKTIDVDNYYMVNDVFDFENSVIELNNSIR